MEDSERRTIRAALQKCAEENKDRPIPTGYIVISLVCEKANERIGELEDLLDKVKEGKAKWVDYDAGEDCYEDTHEGHWEIEK